MKITGRSIESFLRGVDDSVAAVLFYGPDAGLVHERASLLTASIAGDAADPFRVSEVTPDRLRDQPASLSDESAALSLGGNRRVVRLRDAGDAQTAAVTAFLSSAPGGGLVIVESGELGPRSSLRQSFERAENAAAIPCYREEASALARFFDEELGRVGLRLSDDARDFLVSALGDDRAATRREIEKLVTYMGLSTRSTGIELADALACISDAAGYTVDDLAFAVGDGDLAALERLAERVLAEGATAVAVLRAVGRHFLRLHFVASAQGDRDRAVQTLKPPVFYKHVARMNEQVRQWSPARLHRALERITRAEMDCKRTGMPADVLCRRALLEIAGQAPQRARRTA